MIPIRDNKICFFQNKKNELCWKNYNEYDFNSMYRDTHVYFLNYNKMNKLCVFSQSDLSDTIDLDKEEIIYMLNNNLRFNNDTKKILKEYLEKILK